MRKVAYLMSVALTVLLCGCGEDKPTLYVYNWSDYIDPELIVSFEKANNCNVHIDCFDDNESMLAKLMAGGGGYDLIFPSSYATPVMYKNGLIDDLDLSKLTNVINNLDNKFSVHFHEGTMKYSVPYAFSTTGIVYRKDKLPANFTVTNSWNLLTDPVFGGRMSLLRDVREILGIGLKLNGESVNSTNKAEIAAALKTVQKFKKYAAKMDNEQYRTSIVNAEILISMGYVCDVLQIQSENSDTPIVFFIPDEGSTCCWDEMVIPKKSNNKELAYKLIDYLYRPEVAARNASYICTTVPNKGMLQYMDEDAKSNEWLNVSEETLKKLELIRDLGPQVELYNKAWDTFTTNND